MATTKRSDAQSSAIAFAERTAPPAPGGQHVVRVQNRGDGWKVMGFVADTHLGSKHERLDVLRALYDIYAAEGVTQVFHGGNWIEGQSKVNQHDIAVFGLESQLRYFIENYPQRKGITTYYVAGDDHEGWYQQREQLNIGQALQDKAERCGRHDLYYLGYVEADVELKAKSGSAVLRVMHGGGGAPYAYSYALQKTVECVPLESEILTPDGWSRYDEVSEGDTVLGYNIESDRCEWTTLRGITVSPASEITLYKNDNFRVWATGNHRWPMTLEHRAGLNPNSVHPEPYSRTSVGMHSILEMSTDWRRARIVQAAPGPEGPGFEVQSHDKWLDRESTVIAVLQMTSAQRRSFIYGMMIGEGARAGISLVFSQRPGAVNEAFKLACFLEGIAVGSTRIVTKKINGDDKQCGRTTMLRKRHRMVRSMRTVAWRIAPVWCPTTDLGTWVMRQGDTITITGNSFQGGEKPAVLCLGHHHKFDYCMPRNVHALMPGTTCDQSIFMRKRKIEAHVGGVLAWLKQGPDGAIQRFRCEWIPFFDRGYYERRYEV